MTLFVSIQLAPFSTNAGFGGGRRASVGKGRGGCQHGRAGGRRGGGSAARRRGAALQSVASRQPSRPHVRRPLRSASPTSVSPVILPKPHPWLLKEPLLLLRYVECRVIVYAPFTVNVCPVQSRPASPRLATACGVPRGGSPRRQALTLK